jgi:nucleotide-binding universal stress UspA family protein
MYKHILLPTDGSDLSKKAIAHGIELAKAAGATVTALVVSTPFDSLVVQLNANPAALEQYRELVAKQAEQYLAQPQELAAKAGVKCNASCVAHDQPYKGIVEAAKKNRCDLIVMASHGLSGISAMLGSETLKVLTHSSVPVLVYR